MASKEFTEVGEDAARQLRAAGWSWRRLGAAFGVDHQTVRRRLDGRFSAAQLANRRAHTAKKPGYWRFKYLQKQARVQAADEGVPREVVYARWGIDVGYRQWVGDDRAMETRSRA